MIIEQLKSSGLRGRGGAGFPTGLKWETVKNAQAEKKYVVCNASEGEPGVEKDFFIIDNYPEEVIEGIRIALEEIGSGSAYFYLNPDYFPRLEGKVKKAIGNSPITLFKKPHGYICGEESAMLNIIEGKEARPRLKPPFPTEKGLWDCPTLINNVETFYQVAQISKGKYQSDRFYTLNGEAENKGVFRLPENLTLKQVLEQTGNWPDFDFFIQSGGAMSGEILLPSELDGQAGGAGAIIVHKMTEDPLAVMKGWAGFFADQSCGQCVPCREGTYRLKEALDKKELDGALIEDLLFALAETSLCPLGRGAAVPFSGYLKKIYGKH